MTAPVTERPTPGEDTSPLEPSAPAPANGAGAIPPALGVEDVSPEAERKAALLAALAGWCATAGAAWVLSGVFLGWGPRLLALVAATIGPAAVALSVRTQRGTPVQIGGMAAGALLAAGAGLAGRTGSAGLPQLVADALRSGGLAQAPVAFDPGWRVLLVLLVSLLGVASAGLAVATRRPRLAVAVTAPVVAAGTLVQPAEAEVLSAAVALGFVVAGFGVAAAADLVREGASSGGFELRRAGRGAGLLAVLIAALVGASQIGVLLPAPKEDVVVPPQRPQPSPPQPDRELFRVQSERQLPWRLGTLDVYDGTAWLTPPFDPGRFEDLDGGAVPTPTIERPAATVRATFTVEELAGRALPALANPVEIDGDASIQVDPRTQVLRLPAGQSTAGRRYTVVAAAPPTGEQLAAAAKPGEALAPFLEVPPAPPEVADLLEALPEGSDFNRLQAAREAYYSAVVAAGAGDPVDVTPSRVAEMLAGNEASPFEITAGEAILARWVGVPARLGYGWFGGEVDADKGVTALRPKHGATWLEVWFEGHGWVPIVGKPPRAKSSLSKGAKDEDSSVRPTEQLTVFTYVPVRLEGLRQVAAVVRYWVARVVPLLLLAGLALALFPAVRKLRRRRARRRLAAEGGPPARLSAAYAEVRDLLTDIGVSRPSATPLEALDAVDPDDEHTELAWLVTRGLWGDLRRDLNDADAARGEDLAASVARRLQQAQPMGARLAARLSRASLREPWGDVTSASPVRRLRLPSLGWSRRQAAAAAVAAVVAIAGAVTLVQRDTGPRSSMPTVVLPPSEAPVGALPDPLVPDRLGDVVLQREPKAEAAFTKAGESSLVAAGRVYSVRVGDAVEGSLQAVALRRDVASRGDEVVDDVLDSLGGGGFTPVRFGRERGFELRLPEQRILLWFTPDLRAYQLFVARASFDRAGEVFGALLAAQRGQTVEAVPVPVPDPRRRLG